MISTNKSWNETATWRVISKAWSMPRLLRVLKNDSLPGGWRAWAKVQNSLRKRTNSFRRISSDLPSVSCANSSVKNFSSSCLWKQKKKSNIKNRLFQLLFFEIFSNQPKYETKSSSKEISCTKWNLVDQEKTKLPQFKI